MCTIAMSLYTRRKVDIMSKFNNANTAETLASIKIRLHFGGINALGDELALKWLTKRHEAVIIALKQEYISALNVISGGNIPVTNWVTGHDSMEVLGTGYPTPTSFGELYADILGVVVPQGRPDLTEALEASPYCMREAVRRAIIEKIDSILEY